MSSHVVVLLVSPSIYSRFTKVYKVLQHVNTLLILNAYDYKRKRYIPKL